MSVVHPKKKQNSITEMELKSLCRAFTRRNVERLGGLATSEHVEPEIAMRAIAMLMERGWGRPSQEVKVDGTLEVVLRDVMAEKLAAKAQKK